MLEFMRKNKGSISIFLCLIMLPMITYCSMIIDSSRLQASRTQLQCAGDLTMNAAMSEYEKILEDMYGLFGVSEDPEKLRPALENYFYETITGTLNSDEGENEYIKQFSKELAGRIFSANVKEEDISNFLYMQLEDFAYEPVPESRVSNPMIMKSQIIDYMKYKGPVSIASNLLNKVGALKDTGNQADAAKKKIEYTQELSKLDEPMRRAWEAISKYNEQYELLHERGWDDADNVLEMVKKTEEDSQELARRVLLSNYLGEKGEELDYDHVKYYRDKFNVANYEKLTNWHDRMDYIYDEFNKQYTDFNTLYFVDGSVTYSRYFSNKYFYIGWYMAETNVNSPYVHSNTNNINGYRSSFPVTDPQNVKAVAEYRAYYDYLMFMIGEFDALYDEHKNDLDPPGGQKYYYRNRRFRPSTELGSLLGYRLYSLDQARYGLFKNILSTHADFFHNGRVPITQELFQRANELDLAAAKSGKYKWFVESYRRKFSVGEYEKLTSSSQKLTYLRNELKKYYIDIDKPNDHGTDFQNTFMTLEPVLSSGKLTGIKIGEDKGFGYDESLSPTDWKNLSAILELKAYIDYLDFIKTEYERINGETNPEPDKYLKGMEFVQNAVNSSDSCKKLNELIDDLATGNGAPEDTNKELREFYSCLVVMNDSAFKAVLALEDVLNQIDRIESKGQEWKSQIAKVEDDGVRSQMDSDRETLMNNLKREDINALRKVCNECKTFSGDIAGYLIKIQYLELTVSKYPFTFEGLKPNKYLQASAFGDELPNEENIKKIVGKFVFASANNPIEKYVRNNTKDESFFKRFDSLEAIDGKDKAGHEKKEEYFYYVLYNSYGVAPKGLSADEADKADKINEAAEVDGDGNPTGVDKSGGSEETAPENENAGKANEVKTAYDAIVKNNVPAQDTEEYGKAEGGSVSKNGAGDYNKNADSGSSSLSSASKFLKMLANLGEELRDDVYLEEYFTELFTCQTDKKLKDGKLKLINGYSNIPSAAGHYKPINMDNEWYGKEIEYILWGSSDLNKNLRTNETYIFLIRFAVNAIYAFTAADIQSFANSVATALVGWTVVLVPVVSVCITLAIALAESAYDLYMLKEGKDVPILKDAHTFVCSPTGALTKIATEIVKEAAEKATNYIEDEVDKLIDKGVDAAAKTIGDARDTVQSVCNKYADKLTESIRSGIKDQFVAPLVNSITPIVNGLDSALSNSDSIVDEKIDAAFEAIDDSINGMEEGVVKDMTLIFLMRYRDELKADVKNDIKQHIRSIKAQGLSISDISMEEIQKKINEAVDEKINGTIGGFAEDIKSKVKEMTDDMYNEIMSHANEAVSNLKGYVHEQIGEISTQITSNITSQITSSVSNAVVDGIDRSASGGLTLNYKEYCKIFMFIKLLSDSGEKNALLRAGALIQANVRYAVKDPDTNPMGGDKEFEITEAYSIVYIGAKARMSTIFPWGVTIDDDGTGTADANFAITNMGDNSIVINFSGINGY